MGFLDNLPSKSTAESNPRNFALHDASASYLRRRPTLYIPTHNTAPPSSQVITTDCSTTALIRLIRGSAQPSTMAGSSKSAAGSSRAAAGSSKAAGAGSSKAAAAGGKGASGSGAAAAAATTAGETGAGTKGKGKRAAEDEPDRGSAGAGTSAAAGGGKKAKTVGEPGAAAAAGVTNNGARPNFTPEELKGKNNKDLSELLKSLGLPVSGKKEELIRRIMEYQRKQKAAGPS